MQLVGQPVRHVSYGVGVIVEQQERFVLVDFEKIGRKRFVYPDAFSRFLTFENDMYQQQANTRHQKETAEKQVQKKKEFAQHERLGQLHSIKLAPQSQAVFHMTEEEALQCMQSGVVSAGYYLSGSSKGKPKIPNRMKPNTACVLTAIPPHGNEEDRQVIGVFMVAEDFYGVNCKDGQISAHPQHRILLPEGERMRYWDYVSHEATVPRWGRSSFKYITNTEVHNLLLEIKRALCNTEQSKEVEAFYHYYCFVNRMPEMR